MESLSFLFSPHSIAYSIFIIMLVSAIGLAIGEIKIFGVNLGIAGVLFSGILFGHFGFNLKPEIIDFLRDLGLILFVYSIGTQVGPGFFSSFKKEGIKFNLLAASVVLLGIGMTLIVNYLSHIDIATAIGMYTGAVTNTPSLAAAQQAIIGIKATMVNNISVGYALAYPGAIMGIILSMVFIKFVFSKKADEEIKSVEMISGASKLSAISIQVDNKNMDGLRIKDIPAIAEFGIIVSRICRNDNLTIAHGSTEIKVGDILLVVGEIENINKFRLVVGSSSDMDIQKLPSKIINSRIIVTKKNVIGKTLAELGLEEKYNVIITRAARADIEFLVADKYVLQFGDNVVAVGEESCIERVSSLLGNSPKDLRHPQLIPVFVGIVLGVILGSIPIFIPGFSTPVKLGLAGGPLIMAIILSYIQHIGPLHWYMPPSANLMLRELGIVLFLGCVGLKSGTKFFSTLLHGNGLSIMLLAFLITVIPLLIVGIFAKYKLKVKFMALCGILSGSMTDPPALAFANSIATSNLPSMSYATVYPLVMILRVISAQILVILFVR